MASDDDDVIVCEWCPRTCDVLGDDAAIAAGWQMGWDGWTCPGCVKEAATHGE